MIEKLSLNEVTESEPVFVTEADALRYQAQTHPDHAAIQFRGKQLTYRQLDEHADRVSAGIVASQIDAGSRVGVLTKNSDEYFELLFGLIRANRVIVPINWRLAVSEVAFILNDCETETLFIHSSFTGMLGELRSLVPRLKRMIVMDEPGEQGFAAWRDRQMMHDSACVASVVPDDVMVQFYTSGTTGTPKGVEITHRSSRTMRLLEVGKSADFASWGASDVAIVALPNAHLSGTSWALEWFARGATCVVLEQMDATEFLKAIVQFGVTQLFAVPTVLSMMIEHPLRSRTDFASLKIIYYGGAPIAPQLLAQCMNVFQCQFVQLYGMTETNGVLCYLDPADHDLNRPHLLKSCGKPYPMVKLKIMDAEGGELPRGKVGEICVDTPCLMKGYWKRPEALANVMHGRYFRTGDGGYVDDDGFVYLVDRLKDMIVSGGENIYPAEIQAAARDLTGIADIAVIGIPDERWGEAVMAVIVRSDQTVTEQEIMAFLRGRLAGYKLPKVVKFMDTLPYNASGKLLKRRLREVFVESNVKPSS
jgi:acyl-CoA synthetase (AMP-forming)/AMP-acid ligase II